MGIFVPTGMSNSLMHSAQFIPQDTAFSTLPTEVTQGKKGWHSHATDIAGLHEEEGIASPNSGSK